MCFLAICLYVEIKNLLRVDQTIYKVPAKNCTVTVVSANDYREQLNHFSFIMGLNSPSIKQHLLEQGDLTLTRTIDLAETLDSAQRQSSSMKTTDFVQAYSASTAGAISETRNELSFSEDTCESPNASTLTSFSKNENVIFMVAQNVLETYAPLKIALALIW